jgi:hypothetical protein
MANISIGGVTCRIQPADMTLVRPEKTTSIKKTYTGAVYFAWPASIIGKQIDVHWDFMDADEFASFDALYVTDAEVVFDPQDLSGNTFNVNIVSLDGKYLLGLDTTSDSVRKDVKMTLLIMSQV